METHTGEPVPHTFLEDFAQRQACIDAEIANYAETARSESIEKYGELRTLPTEAVLRILEADGKRLRGALTMVGYELADGKDREMITKAATYMEVHQAYLLVIDDLQDNSEIRRGQPTANSFIRQEIEKLPEVYGLDSAHTAGALAINGALGQSHRATRLLGQLDRVSPDLRLRAVNALHEAMEPTGVGQSGDLLGSFADSTEEEILRATRDKTAHYTFLAPLQVGMILAGRSSHAEIIRPYAMALGEAYQLGNDLEVLSTSGEVKDPAEDLREAKQTLLVHQAMQYANQPDKLALMNMLGNPDLDANNLKQCQEIFINSGAVAYVQDRISLCVDEALESLDRVPRSWDADKSKDFLTHVGWMILARAQYDS